MQEEWQTAISERLIQTTLLTHACSGHHISPGRKDIQQILTWRPQDEALKEELAAYKASLFGTKKWQILLNKRNNFERQTTPDKKKIWRNYQTLHWRYRLRSEATPINSGKQRKANQPSYTMKTSQRHIYVKYYWFIRREDRRHSSRGLLFNGSTGEVGTELHRRSPQHRNRLLHWRQYIGTNATVITESVADNI